MDGKRLGEWLCAIVARLHAPYNGTEFSGKTHKNGPPEMRKMPLGRLFFAKKIRREAQGKLFPLQALRSEKVHFFYNDFLGFKKGGGGGTPPYKKLN